MTPKTGIEEIILSWKHEKLIKDEKVIEAFRHINREFFVLPHLKEEAYLDVPLPIGHGQTISQPTTIAIMTENLELENGMKVLEVGTGSGYQSALIGHIIGKRGHVFTTELIQDLANSAKQALKKAGIENVTVIESDGSMGYSQEAPYDRIIVTAACPEIPQELIKQLKKNGIMILPVGSLEAQKMLKIRKIDEEGKLLDVKNLGDFVFVPLRGKYGFR